MVDPSLHLKLGRGRRARRHEPDPRASMRTGALFPVTARLAPDVPFTRADTPPSPGHARLGGAKLGPRGPDEDCHRPPRRGHRAHALRPGGMTRHRPDASRATGTPMRRIAPEVRIARVP